METLEQTKLGMINDSLLSIGEVPLPEDTLVDPEYDSNGNIIVFSDIQEGTDASVARDLVVKTMVKVQNRGWSFNTDYNFKFVPDSNNMIELPNDVLRIDVGNTSNKGKIIIKKRKLYNLETQSFIFKEPVFADVVWFVDYTDLTPSAYQYISLRSARSFQQKVVSNGTLDQFAQQEEQDALNYLLREDLQSRDYTVVNNRVTQRNRNPVRY